MNKAVKNEHKMKKKCHLSPSTLLAGTSILPPQGLNPGAVAAACALWLGGLCA